MQLIKNLKAAKQAGVRVTSYSMTETDRGIAWSAIVHVGSKKLGMVCNRGDGGMDRVEFNADSQRLVVEALKSAGYVLDLEYEGLKVDEPTDIEGWLTYAVPQIGDELKALASWKRKCKSGVYFEQACEPKISGYKVQDSAAVRAQIKQKHPTLTVFLNDEFAALS